MIKYYKEWLNESSSSFDRSLDMLVYKCLKSFSPEGGNCSGFDSAKVPEGIFGPWGPDIWVNCGDFDGEIKEELDELSRIYKNPSKRDYLMNDFDLGTRKIIERFDHYGMCIETLIDDEVVVRLGGLSYYRNRQLETTAEYWKSVVKFYTHTQQNGIKELEHKLRHVITGKQFNV